jgi:hypothetical protein
MTTCPELDELRAGTAPGVEAHLAACGPCRIIAALLRRERRPLTAPERDAKCARLAGDPPDGA